MRMLPAFTVFELHQKVWYRSICIGISFQISAHEGQYLSWFALARGRKIFQDTVYPFNDTLHLTICTLTTFTLLIAKSTKKIEIQSLAHRLIGNRSGFPTIYLLFTYDQRAENYRCSLIFIWMA